MRICFKKDPSHHYLGLLSKENNFREDFPAPAKQYPIGWPLVMLCHLLQLHFPHCTQQ